MPPPPPPGLTGPWAARFARPGPDVDLLVEWMRQPHVEAYWHQAWDADRWRAELTRQFAGVHSRPCLITDNGVPFAYLEVYRVALDVLAGAYRHGPDDLGVHIAIGDTAHTGRGLGTRLLTEVTDSLLRRVSRVVAEPDVRNVHSIRAFTRAGYQTIGEIPLPDKRALLLCAGAAVAPAMLR